MNPPATTVPVPILPSRWGKDHWSTLAYARTCEVGHVRLDPRRMRTNFDVHPELQNGPEATNYPTRLGDGCLLMNHDDWDILEDAEAAGLVVNRGTGTHRVYEFTARGKEVSDALNAHKGSGGTFATFRGIP